MMKISKTICAIVLAATALSSCNHVENQRIPYAPVSIDLTYQSTWAVYGVQALGDYRYFNRAKRLPANFPYTATTYTGFGGVLLIGAGAGDVVPMAFDMACPVERDANVAISIDPNNLDAVCPNCGSHFNVLTGAGMPIKGEALQKNYVLTRYNALPAATGGYRITN